MAITVLFRSRTLNDALTVQMEVAEAIAAAVVQSLTHLREAVGF